MTTVHNSRQQLFKSINSEEAPGTDLYHQTRSTERWPRFAIVLLVLYAVVRAIVAAHARPLWFDEIFTWALARQPNLGAIWGALLKGVDTQGLLFDIVQRAVVGVPNIEIGFRLPSILGFACTTICVYVFVERRSGGFLGLISAASLMLTALYVPVRALPCAIDARGYSLSVACIALGLVAYQRAATLRWAAALAVALALGVSFNYYTVFAIVPFAAAEAVYFLPSSKIRWTVWGAIAFGAVPLVFFLPHVKALKHTLASGYFAQPTLPASRDAYGHFLSVSNYWGMAVFVVFVVGLLLTFQPVAQNLSAGSIRNIFQLNIFKHDRRDRLAELFPHERVLALFLLVTPFTVLVASRIVHGAYFYHYMLYSILGIALAAGFILPALERRVMILASVFLVSALFVQEASFWLSSRAWHFQSPTVVAADALASAGMSDLPIFVETPHDYLPMAFYATPELSKRLVFMADGPSALRYGGFDTDDVELELLSQYLPLNVTDFQSFRSSRQAFLMYAAMPDPHDWWLRRLIDGGYTVQFKSYEPLLSDQDGIVYLVSPGASKP